MPHSLEPIIHEIPHNEEVDDLRNHEPVSHIFRQQTHRRFSVQLRVRENPKDNEENPGDSLRRHEVGGV